MKGAFSKIGKSCSSLSSYVQAKVDRIAKKKKPSQQEEFLADIEGLHRTLEMRERAKENEKVEAATPGMESNMTPSDYVPIEEQTQEANHGKIEQIDVVQAEPAPEDVPFFWELLRFAKNRSWKKKIMTYVSTRTSRFCYSRNALITLFSFNSALIVSISIYVIIDLVFLGHIMNLITRFLHWMTLHPAGAVVCFLGFFILATLFFVPPTILYFGAGYAFSDIAGFWGGFFAAIVVCFIGSSLGAMLAFLRSRYMMRDLVELFAKRFPIVKCLDEAMRTEGFRVMAMLRLCPIIPFNALNHVGGITRISLEEYTFALVGVLPNIGLWVMVGATADHIRTTETDDKEEYVFYIVVMVGGIIFAMVGLFLLYRFARFELHKEIKAQRALSWHTFADRSARPSNDTSTVALEDVEKGFDAVDIQPGGFIAALGLDHHGVEAKLIPEDGSDEDWLWVWA